MATAEAQGIGRYTAVYFCLLVITSLQFFIGYQNIEGSHLVVRFLTFPGGVILDEPGLGKGRVC
jgi:hypothetical protein